MRKIGLLVSELNGTTPNQVLAETDITDYILVARKPNNMAILKTNVVGNDDHVIGMAAAVMESAVNILKQIDLVHMAIPLILKLVDTAGGNPEDHIARMVSDEDKLESIIETLNNAPPLVLAGVPRVLYDKLSDEMKAKVDEAKEACGVGGMY